MSSWSSPSIIFGWLWKQAEENQRELRKIGAPQMAKLKTDEAVHQELVKLKGDIKTGSAKFSAQAKALYDKYKEQIKKSDRDKAIFQKKLLDLLNDAHEVADTEIRNQKHWFSELATKSGKWLVSWFASDPGSNFKPLLGEIQKFYIEFNHQYAILKEKIKAVKKSEDMDKINQDIGKLKEKLKTDLESLRQKIESYIAIKYAQTRTCFEEFFKKCTEMKASDAKTACENLVSNLPTIMVFFKMLASVAGIRSPLPNGETPPSKHGEDFGHGALAKMCKMSFDKLDEKLRAQRLTIDLPNVPNASDSPAQAAASQAASQPDA